ncbi:SHOCT domain-containing protein [Anaerofustis butyriciformans]|uniref:SHOCT domain-containing protein n=1 Tax=Anaerofustis butyriciformans TaxID=3108533 RepID=UPI002E3077FD|nr:SHOCT domain-containing protein [Anaerofustis sp. HA2171]
MGLLSKEQCTICGKKLKCKKLNNYSFICSNCISLTGLDLETLKNFSNVQIIERINHVKIAEKLNQEKISNFVPTKKFENYIWFDDTNKWFAIPSGTIKYNINNSHIFSYDEIINYEVIEDGTTVSTGGLGKAIVGGALFGIAGAIAGGTSKKNKQVCTKLDIKITTKDLENPVAIINVISTELKKSGILYDAAYKSTQQILSKLQLILNEFEENNISDSNLSIADEIKKYKELLDINAISQDEFDKIKSKLLNL